MNTKIKNRCVTLLAREHGLASLKELQLSGDFEIVAIFTHKFNPKSYDPEQKIRDDFSDFKLFAKENHIPLFTIDSKDEKKVLEQRYNFGKYFQEHDKRRGTDFCKTFPELADFYRYCLEIKL